MLLWVTIAVLADAGRSTITRVIHEHGLGDEAALSWSLPEHLDVAVGPELDEPVG